MLGIVSDEIFEKELLLTQQITAPSGGIIVDITRGRGSINEVPPILRQIIAEDAILSDQTAAELSAKYNVSPSSISAYKHGATSTASYHEPDEALARNNDRIRTDIISSARSRLISALEHITPEKLSTAKLRDTASVAKDMSVIIKNMEPEVIGAQDKAPQFIFYAPQISREDRYEVIDVKE